MISYFFKKNITFLFILCSLIVFAQEIVQKDSITIVFMGDIMGHSPQIKAAYDKKTKTYNYDDVFKNVAPIIKKADFAIANLEVTLAGKPYKGYPQFSSPDALAVAAKKSGIDILVTANNHSCDRGKKGILKTLNVLDTLKIPHTGTFRNIKEKVASNLLIFNKNNIKVGLLNYTYGTNGLPIPEGTFVNEIDTLKILRDINYSKFQNKTFDKLIVMLHWGNEYKSNPSKEQVKIADFLFKNGVDIIIGGHPHVLQKMEFTKKTKTAKEKLITYSLGNFVSNQRTRKRDGGAMVQLTLTKTNGITKISNAGYYLTWVYKHKVDGKDKFEIVPCATYEANKFSDINEKDREKIKLFMSDSRALFKKNNLLVDEIKTPIKL